MMGEIVDDGHAAFDAANLDAAFDRFESVERLLDLLFRNSPRVGRDDHGQAIADVELADQMRFEFAPRVRRL